jgi:hypothetical protein
MPAFVTGGEKKEGVANEEKMDGGRSMGVVYCPSMDFRV